MNTPAIDAAIEIARSTKIKKRKPTVWCANCEIEATHFTADTRTPLCHTCKTAYEWGQASPEQGISPIDEYYDEEDE